MNELQKLHNTKRFTIVLLSITSLFALLTAIVGIYEYTSLQSLPSENSTESIPLELRETLGQMTLLVIFPRLVLFLITAVVFLRWTYVLFNVAKKNLEDGEVNNAGWIVSFFIIPFMNFFLPLLAFLDLSKKMAIKQLGEKDKKQNTLIIFWWVFFLFSMLMTMSSGFFTVENATISMIQNDALTTSLSEFTLFIAGILAIFVVRNLTNQQSNRT
ncbi:hypothetical protein DH09_03040 [Bacillaceae bacterium JMAK1]|nr:hypothetical protein DH09_03040 [Bacillaceae bacterium JMAK1]